MVSEFEKIFPEQPDYADIWQRLNEINVRPLAERSDAAIADPSFERARKHFAERVSAITIDLRNLTKENEDFLKAKGISSKYLRRNFAKTTGRKYRDSRAFQLNAVRNRAVYAICPFSGKLVKSAHSFLANINAIFYRFHSQQVFYIAVAGIASGFQKGAIYFPEYELIVSAGDPWGLHESDVVELKARMVSHFDLCRRYISGPAKTKVAVCLGYYHFAHHLWNELAGLYRLCKGGLLDRVDKFIVMREPLGALEQIFPEISSASIERVDTTETLFKKILDGSYLVIRIGDNFVVRDLIKRVNGVALRNCSADTQEKIRAARARYDPLLWIGIRVGNRAWIEQAHGLARLVDSLHEEFPKLGVIFDGFSLPADKSVQASDREEYKDIITQENAIVDEVVQGLRHSNGLGIFNIIGSSIFDAIAWANSIDVYVTPFGTLQHKVGWLANKRGLIHTNRNLLGADYIWTVIEKPTIPSYVSSSNVTDVRCIQTDVVIYKQLRDRSEVGSGVIAVDRKVQANAEFDNYVVEWQALRVELSGLIRSRKSSLSFSLFGLSTNSRHKLKKSLRSLIGYMDNSKI